jgi:histidinol phosphatase-like enzyme (inositol monophosphatase family)
MRMVAVDFSSFVDELATRSATAILPFFRTAMTAQDKNKGGVFDPVTEADRAGEAVMRHKITQTFPDHGIIGEEFGRERGDAEFVWVLDPIDGTKAFISGLPTWGTLIGLTRHGTPCYGMMHQPFTQERFFGDGKAATFKGPHGTRALRTRTCPDLAQATLSTTTPRMFTGDLLERYMRIESEARLTRFGCDCYAYSMLAAGHIDVVVETALNSYDIVALVPIIEGAGGIVTTWDGGAPAQGGSIVASGDKRLHEQVLHRLRG